MRDYQIYPTDLTDKQWQCIKELIPAKKRRGRPRELDMRLVVNAILYVVVGGSQWRMLPKDYPKWKSVYHCFRQWRNKRVWQRIHDTLRARLRQRLGRHKHPSAGCLDSQSVKTTECSNQRGFDAGKLVKGTKRHILVDTLGLLLAVGVTSAAIQDRDGARLLFSQLSGACKKLRLIWVDGSYRGQLLVWVAAHFRFHLKPVLRDPKTKGFVLLHRRSRC